MDIDKPNLFIEINDNHFNFLVGKYDEDLNFEVINKKSILSIGFKAGRITNSKDFFENIKNTILEIEKSVNYTFKETIVILESPSFLNINISGFKNLNNSQISEDDITFIINSLKKTVSDNSNNFSIVHLFNSKFILDNKSSDNLPIGLIGNKYSHELSFFLLPSNDIKNISATFSKINLQINRVINKNFLEGISQVKKTGIKKFFLINLGDIKSDILFFDNSVFKYSESFNFGTHILKKDVCKVCSLSISNVEKIFSKINFNNSKLNDETLLNKEYFSGDLYRKISMKHIREIIEARLEEILDLVYLKNINLEYLQNHSTEILINIEKENIFQNQSELIKNKFPSHHKIEIVNKTHIDQFVNCEIASELISRGWENEVISFTRQKKSIISRIFSFFFK